jgi:hypothetical protein
LDIVPQLFSRHQESYTIDDRILSRAVFPGSNQGFNELHAVGGQIKVHTLPHKP